RRSCTRPEPSAWSGSWRPGGGSWRGRAVVPHRTASRRRQCDIPASPSVLTVSAPNYDLVGKRVRAHLYDHGGRLLGALEGRVADVAAGVPVGRDAAGNEIRKDLAYVVDI